MRIGTSRADRYGFAVFVVLASLLAVLLVTSLGDDTTDSAQEVSTFADVAPPTAVPTTVAVSMPEPTPTATPTPDPTPVPVEPASAPEDEDEDEEVEADADESSTADSSGSDAGTTSTASAGTSESSTAAAAPAAESTGGSVPNPQAPAATAIPNPQPATSPVPNPQPATSPVPNPQPGTQQASAPANVPADAPAGGTFTHTLTATVARPSLHTTAGGPIFTPAFNGQALPAVNPTVFGNPLVYRVLAGAPGDTWAKVYVPARPNGTVAWVQTSQFRWGSSNQLLQINISNNTVTLFEGSNVLITTAAVTGKSTSRTPRANGWVEEIMAGPSSAYGPRLISLGIFSDDLNSFGSRNAIPKIALHGTNNPGLMGQYASNGCIRVPNDVISAIASRVIPGSKVIIVG